MNLRLLARPAIFLAVALTLWLAADLLWSVGMEIRETALNPACQLFQARVEMGLDCDSQNQFGFFLAIICGAVLYLLWDRAWNDLLLPAAILVVT